MIFGTTERCVWSYATWSTEVRHKFRDLRDLLDNSEEKVMLYTIIALLVAFWLVGLVAHVGGGFIHTLLVLAAVIFVFDLVTGRRAV